MAQFRSLLALVLLATSLHVWSISRTLLPAQDGLKFIRVAQEFQSSSWWDAVRGADIHPLYPALVATAEPIVALFRDKGPDTWRIAAQSIAACASLGLVLVIFCLTRSLFDKRIALIAATLLALLPRAAELGHDTLADSLGLFLTFLGFWLAARAWRTTDWRTAFASGLACGFGYLARPEVILAPIAIGLTWIMILTAPKNQRQICRILVLPVLLLAVMFVVSSYAMIKGEISEKLALRYGALLGPKAIASRTAPQLVTQGLDDQRLDFSPKEETEHIPIRNLRSSVLRISSKWWEEMCWGFAVMTGWGLVRRHHIRGLLPDCNLSDSNNFEGRLLLTFTCVFLLAILRHSTNLGYLSGRHIMPLVVASVPWAAAGTFVCCRGISVKLGWNRGRVQLAGVAAAGLAILGSIYTQMQPGHLNHVSRWGHWAAGSWLARNAKPDEKVLDTRGWARFISGQPGYDYWHVRQALTDSQLAYIVVGLDELEAMSSRSMTLNALLAYSATPLADFPSSRTDPNPVVRLYRFHRPDSWKGLLQ